MWGGEVEGRYEVRWMVSFDIEIEISSCENLVKYNSNVNAPTRYHLYLTHLWIILPAELLMKYLPRASSSSTSWIGTGLSLLGCAGWTPRSSGGDRGGRGTAMPMTGRRRLLFLLGWC